MYINDGTYKSLAIVIFIYPLLIKSILFDFVKYFDQINFKSIPLYIKYFPFLWKHSKYLIKF